MNFFGNSNLHKRAFELGLKKMSIQKSTSCERIGSPYDFSKYCRVLTAFEHMR
jgi:hypothetical protein